jgi:saccharopepsin
MMTYKAAFLLVCSVCISACNPLSSSLLGDYDPKYTQISGSNRISTWPIRNPYRWNVLIDAVIVNGSIVVPSTKVTGAPSNKAVALMDSGSSYR